MTLLIFQALKEVKNLVFVQNQLEGICPIGFLF